MSESTRMMLGLVIGIAIMIVLVMKTKVHTFIALLLAALITGLIGGMPVADITNAAGETTVGVMTAIKDGFGNTLKSTGIIIGLGVMMGGILEVSGAAEQLAFTFIRVIGKRKEEWALAITGWVVSIPVFADSAIVIFAPLVKAMSSVTGISVVGLALSLACGLQLTHCLVPPTPGPLTAAGMLGVDVGQMIMVGAGISIPMLIVVVFYCKYIGKKIYQIPNEDGHGYERKEFKKEYIKSMEEVEKLVGEKNLPSFTASILPIIIPIVLIFVKTFWGLFGTGEGVANTIISLVGEPIFALGSATVAITTAASLTAPLMAAISVSPILLAASCCVGAISFSYFNDSGFWVFNGMFGLTELKDQVRCKTAVSLIMAGVGIIELLLLQFVL